MRRREFITLLGGVAARRPAFNWRNLRGVLQQDARLKEFYSFPSRLAYSKYWIALERNNLNRGELFCCPGSFLLSPHDGRSL